MTRTPIVAELTIVRDVAEVHAARRRNPISTALVDDLAERQVTRGDSAPRDRPMLRRRDRFEVGVSRTEHALRDARLSYFWVVADRTEVYL
jgi:hypothetical protein